jgi:uncharacterized protein
MAGRYVRFIIDNSLLLVVGAVAGLIWANFASFDEAVTVFLDGDALDGPDLHHSRDEMRFLRLGRSADRRVLMVAYTLRRSGDAETIRIISARRAGRRERSAYSAKD